MAVLLSRGWRRALQIAGVWYALLLIVSLLVSPADLHAAAIRVWPSALEPRAEHVCVTCGLTRSFSAMSRADVAAAARFNAAGPALYVLMGAIAIFGVGSAARELRGSGVRKPRTPEPRNPGTPEPQHP